MLLILFFFKHVKTERQDKWSLAAPGLKIMLPKSLDSDSAEGVVYPHPSCAKHSRSPF